MSWRDIPPLQRLIQALIVPTADLGLKGNDVPPLVLGDDVPVVLAMQMLSTPTGPRLLQGSPVGRSNASYGAPITLLRSTTEGAGNTGRVDLQGYVSAFFLVEILALNGAPTNIQYRPAISFDGAAWYEGSNATATVAGLVVVSIGPGYSTPTVANNVVAVAAFAGAQYPNIRLDWVFTAGAAPTVQHRIWLILS